MGPDAMNSVLARVQSIHAEFAGRIERLAPDRASFSEMLNQRLGGAEAPVPFVRMTPANLALMRSVPLAAKAPSPAVSPLSADTAEKKAIYDPLVRAAAAKYGLSADLIHAVIRAESSYNANAVSRVGAQGLMQLMPATARGLGVTDSFNPAQNIDGGARYLRQMLDRYGGDERLALAAYNCGPGRVAELGIASSADAAAYTRLSSGVRSYVTTVQNYKNA